MKNSGIEWIGEIPDDWKVERLQWYIEEVKIPNNPMQTDRVLSLTNKAGVIPYEEKGAQGNVAKEDYTQYKLAYPNTIVANSMNILIGSVGICNYFGCVSPVYYVFKPTKKADLLFINYIMQTIPFQKELRRYANGILEIRLRVSASGILKRKIAIPNLKKQKNIVDEINKKCAAVDRLIENQRAQIEKLKEYKQSVITEAVTRGLDSSAPMKDSGIEWLGKIPIDWNVLRIKNLGNLQNGISKNGEFFGTGFPFVSYGDVYKNIELPNKISGLIESSNEERIRYSVQKKDIFFTRTSETIEEVGFSSVCMQTIANATFAGFLIRLRPFTKKLLSNYAKYYFRGQHIRTYLVKEMNIVTRASLSQDLLSAMQVLVPPLEEQQQIANYLDKKCAEIDKLIAIKQQKIETLTEYKKSLIYEYVTGKKQVI